MIGEARNLDKSLPFAAVLDGTVARLEDLSCRLRRVAATRLRAAPQAAQMRPAGTSVIPTVRYRDVPKAVEWLCRAFGMRVHRVIADTNGAPRYAELTIGNGMLMVAPIEDTPFGKLMVQPDEIGGVETQVCYLCVTNARAHYRRARAAGAVIVLHPDDEANGGRGYSCRDPEGHVWNFGTYDPWAGWVPAPAAAGWRSWQPGRLQQGLAALVTLALAGALLANLVPQPSARAGTAAIVRQAAEASAEASPAPPAFDDLRSKLAAAATNDTTERGTPAPNLAIEAAERRAAQVRAELVQMRAALEKAEREAATTRGQLDDLQGARQAAERTAAEARALLAAAQERAERARAEAAQERARRLAADRAATAARRRRATVNLMRQRLRSGRSWCYHPNNPNPVPGTPGPLFGFCRT